MSDSGTGLTVAVTGPTGDIGRALMRALDADPGIDRVVGMARRPFDPAAHGMSKVHYQQGDILDRDAVRLLVHDADVVVHLAFMIFGSPDESWEVNIDGSRNVFEEALGAGVSRLVYASSVAAYGFHDDNPELLTEEIPARGSDEHPYSAQKARLEEALYDMIAGAKTELYVFRPCIVAGPSALALIEKIPYVSLAEKLPGPIRKLAGSIPLLRPVIPDPGTPLQLVHEDDVARAFLAAIHGRGEPGPYNLAADGEISLTDLAHALGWYAIPIPELAVDATARVISRLPLMPVEARWVSAVKVPVLMDCSKARAKLGWKPEHDALETLAETIHGARQAGLLPWRTPEPAEL